jgi:hypothetical protein
MTSWDVDLSGVKEELRLISNQLDLLNDRMKNLLIILQSMIE